MRYIAGIDIGNSSTEVALATLSATGELSFVSSALAETTGIKGTLRNVHGIQEALAQATKKVGINVSDISLIRINEATPVIGDVAMETITETIITESTMIGHNPKTPGGVGLGVGLTITPQELLTRPADTPYILVVSSAFDFADIATMINAWKFLYLLWMKSSTSIVFRSACWQQLKLPFPGKLSKPCLTRMGLPPYSPSMLKRLKILFLSRGR